MIRIAVVDDHPIVREGLVSVLDDEADMRIVGSVDSVEDLVARVAQWQPDVVLLDLELPGASGRDAVRVLVEASPATRIIVFTAFGDEDTIVRIVRAGARGYILKGAPASVVAQAIRDVYDGRTHLPADVVRALAERDTPPRKATELSAREMQVLRLVGEGLSNKQIARRLGITERTVKFHLNSVMGKLGAENRAQAVAIASRRRLLV